MAKVDDEQNPGSWRHFRRLKVNKNALRKRARKMESVTLKHAHRFITRRWTNVRDVARNTSAWLIAVGLLIGLSFLQSVWFQQAYTVVAPENGGTYAEGMIGRVETTNPLFASSTAEVSVSKLIFSSLLDYDTDNILRPSVAKSWHISEDGKVYSVQLRDDVFWHDGQKLTVDDVLFTVRLMQNESVRAKQYGSWAGVKVEKRSKSEIVFTLPSVYAPFAHSLTFGILPQHILKDVTPADIRENNFGRQPIGSGPFVFKRFQVINPDTDRLVVHMEANDHYFRGAPLLNRFQLHTYEDYDALERAFRTQEVNAALGLRANQIAALSTLRQDYKASDTLLGDGVYALFNADSPILGDKGLRQALLLGTNRQAVVRSIDGRGAGLNGPLPASFTSTTTAKQASHNTQDAQSRLDALGWKQDGAVRKKDGAELALSMVAPESGDYKTIVNEIAKQWRELGVKVTVQFASTQEIASTYLQPRNYDVLVYEFAIGADPDVYSYWHSSQAKPTGLNFANYRSGAADDALSSARSRLDIPLRTAKYKAFTEQWLADTPAIALYQPWLSYITTESSTSLDDGVSVADISARYRNVERWAVSNGRVMATP